MIPHSNGEYVFAPKIDQIVDMNTHSIRVYSIKYVTHCLMIARIIVDINAHR